MKTVRIQAARKVQSRASAESIASSLGGAVESLRILDGLEVREVYMVVFPYDPSLRLARRAQYVGRPCYLSA